MGEAMHAFLETRLHMGLTGKIPGHQLDRLVGTHPSHLSRFPLLLPALLSTPLSILDPSLQNRPPEAQPLHGLHRR